MFDWREMHVIILKETSSYFFVHLKKGVFNLCVGVIGDSPAMQLTELCLDLRSGAVDDNGATSIIERVAPLIDLREFSKRLLAYVREAAGIVPNSIREALRVGAYSDAILRAIEGLGGAAFRGLIVLFLSDHSEWVDDEKLRLSFVRAARNICTDIDLCDAMRFTFSTIGW